MTLAARPGQSPFSTKLREHLGVDPLELPSTVAEFAAPNHPNLQLALEAVDSPPATGGSTRAEVTRWQRAPQRHRPRRTGRRTDSPDPCRGRAAVTRRRVPPAEGGNRGSR